MEGYEQGDRRERMGKNVQGIRSINGGYKIDRGEIKNSIGNVRSQKTCMYDPWT